MDASEYKARGWTRIQDAIRRIRPYYAANPSGGELHVALDDGNLDASDVLWCLNQAQSVGDKEAVAIAKMLLDMSVDERYELYEFYSQYASE